MWGENTRPSSRRDGPSAAASIDGESDITVTDGAVSHPLVHTSDEEEAAFRRRSSRFDDAVNSYNNLMRSLEEHKVALARVAESGAIVAEQLNKFFGPKDSHRELAASFLAAQRDAQCKWSNFERRYEKDVMSHIKNRVEEIPLVRAGMKQRANALAAMQRLQRKTTASERKVDGPFAKVKQRRLKELKDVSATYAMHHSDVMRMFSNIERNSGNFVSPALVALVALLADAGQTSVDTLDNVLKLASDVPPMTRELSPAPMSESRIGTYHSDGPRETWDEDFEDMMVSPALSPPLQPVHGDASSAGTHTRSRSEPVNNVPTSIHSIPPVEKRRVVHSTDTASLPEVLEMRNGQYVSTRQPPENGYGPGNSSGGLPNAPRTGASGSSSSGERVGTDENVTVNGGYSELSGRRERVRTDVRDRRHTREGMGSSDTVPSESNQMDVQMRLMVLYDFSPREVNEIQLRKGDVVEVTEKNDAGWWFGRCRRQTGYFPRNYTRELTDQEEADFVSKARKRRQGHRRNNSQNSRKSASVAPQLAVVQP